jgi:hypothetical protein
VPGWNLPEAVQLSCGSPRIMSTLGSLFENDTHAVNQLYLCNLIVKCAGLFFRPFLFFSLRLFSFVDINKLT